MLEGQFDPMTHEVDYHQYCPLCKHFDDAEYPDPCNECLTYPINTNGSRKPINFEAKDDEL